MVIRTNSNIAEIIVYTIALIIVVLMMAVLTPSAAEPHREVNTFKKDILVDDDSPNFIITFDDNELISTRCSGANHWDELMFYEHTEKICKKYTNN